MFEVEDAIVFEEVLRSSQARLKMKLSCDRVGSRFPWSRSRASFVFYRVFEGKDVDLSQSVLAGKSKSNLVLPYFNALLVSLIK